MKQFLKRNFLTVLLFLLFCILYTGTIIYFSDKIKEEKLLTQTSYSELEVWKGKDNSTHAKIAVLESEKVKTFTDLQTKDSIIISLQEEVKKHKKNLKKSGSVTKIETKTEVVYKEKRNPTLNSDTLHFSNINFQEWIKGKLLVQTDSVDLTLKIKNDYTVVIGQESQGWFKPKKTFAEITNKNPYSTIETMRTYAVTAPKTKRWSIGAGMGAGIDMSGKFQATVGIYVGWAVWQW